MNATREALVRQTWPLVAERGDGAARAFLTRLLELDPTARDTFRDLDFDGEGDGLAPMLAGIIERLDRPAELVAAVATMARRHEHLRLQDGHYRSLGAALLHAVERSLGPDCTPDVRQAWADTYALIVALMQRAAGPPGGRTTTTSAPARGRTGPFRGPDDRRGDRTDSRAAGEVRNR